MKKWIATCSSLFVSTSLVFGGVVHADTVDEVRKIVAENYVDPVPNSTLALSTAQEILGKLDRYSTYFTAAEYADFVNSIEGNSKGIGILYTMGSVGAKVDVVLKLSPAEAAGLKAGDIIETVNGQPIAGKTADYFRSLVKQYGDALTLTVLRNNTTVTINLAVGEIKIPTVEGQKLAGNIGYIHLNSFDQKAGEEIRAEAAKLGKVNGWIFDLRDNGGGYVTAAADVARLFPKITNATVFKYREGKEWLPVRNANDKDNPIFTNATDVLINGNSASASEMTAGAVKDYKVAKLVGQRSYGKGSMQTMFTLTNKDVIKLTIARFYSPLTETPIHEVGVKPDITTAVGKEVITAHEDLLKRATLRTYKPLAANSVTVNGDKVVVKVARSSAIDVAKVAVYRLAGQAKVVPAQMKANGEIEITFAKNNKDYYYIVLPTKSGVTKGYYVKF